MAFQSLKDLYIDQLRDLYDAEQQVSRAMPDLIKASSSPDLRDSFRKHLDETKFQLERLDLIFKKLGQSPEGRRCRGIEGIIAEGHELIQEGSAPDVADAAIIAAAQRVEHYEMAAYGCARTFAERLDDHYAAELLQQTLLEEEATDQLLSDIAEGGINQSAGEGKEIHSSRLSYLNTAQLPTDRVNFADLHVRGDADDDLGRVDGFVVDRTSGHPYYVVVDSGGWFTGSRYLLPVDSVRFQRGDREMRVSVDKQTIRKYPAFDAGAFERVDEQSREYEDQLLRAYDREPGEPRGRDSETRGTLRRPDWWITEGVSVTRGAAPPSRSPGSEPGLTTPRRRGPATEQPDEDRRAPGEGRSIVNGGGESEDRPRRR